MIKLIEIKEDLSNLQVGNVVRRSTPEESWAFGDCVVTRIDGDDVGLSRPYAYAHGALENNKHALVGIESWVVYRPMFVKAYSIIAELSLQPARTTAVTMKT